jgi:DNA-binding GntR family transcriptional regulator
VKKTDYVYEKIKRKIISWEYPPLSHISEDEIQRELEVSRTPVREALQKLEKEGFLYVYPRKGTIVSEVSSTLIDEIYEIREANEANMAVKASKWLSRDWLMDILYRFENPPDVSGEELISYFMKLDTELHTTICKNSRNRFLIGLMQVVYDHNERVRRRSSSLIISNSDNAVQAHIKIIKALLAKDDAKIREVSNAHIKAAKEISKKLLV